MNKIMMSSNFNYHEINAFSIQKIIEKIKKCNILLYSRSITVRYNFFLKISFQLLLKSLKIEMK